MPMLADVHLGERAGVSHPHHLHSEVTEEVDDLQRLAAQAEDEDERGDDRTEQFLQDEHLRQVRQQVRLPLNLISQNAENNTGKE